LIACPLPLRETVFHAEAKKAKLAKNAEKNKTPFTLFTPWWNE
jgi:hypothetical protein